MKRAGETVIALAMWCGRATLAAAVMTALVNEPAAAQTYRGRVDAGVQVVSFRGLQSDSIDASLVVTSESGGFETPDGFAVRCGASAHCFFFRPGDVVRGVPFTTTGSVVLWGFGVEGLSFRAAARYLTDLGRDGVWPATEPSAQILEGYFDYQRPGLVGRAGRQFVASRLEPIGFDGGWLRLRAERMSLEITGYGGWGLGQAVSVPATSPALNPLDEWRPDDRQLVAGAEAAWLHRDVDVRAEYRREIDPLDGYFVSERTAVSFGARLAEFRASGGIDYNIAEGHVGNADVVVTWLQPRFTISGGVRRYRPYFSLWTLWGAFSPVPYHAGHVSAEVRATDRLVLHARGERYRYENAAISTALVPLLQDRGWRVNTGATATLNPDLRLDGSYGMEYGPGAAGRFANGSVSFTPGDRYAFDVYGGAMVRPLELRYYDATSRWIGGRAEVQLDGQRRLWTDMALVGDDRDRPDAAATSVSQFRVRAGVSLSFGSGADRNRLPPARRPGG